MWVVLKYKKNELDLLKTKKGKVGYAARKSIKNLYDCFIEKSSNLNVNFDINLNSTISNDENIIQSAIDNKAILLSNDLNMQILASAPSFIYETWHQCQVSDMNIGTDVNAWSIMTQVDS